MTSPMRPSMRGRGALIAALALWALAGCRGPGAADAAEPAPAPNTTATGEATAGATLDGELKTALGDRFATSLSGAVLEAHFIDIGQGDAILLRSPGGKTVLIDTGPPGADPTVRGYLDGLGVERIDLLVNSHPHSDHIGNTAALIERMPVGRVLDPGFAHPTATYEQLVETIARKAVPLRLVRTGQRITLDAGITMTVLGPAEPLIEGSRSDANANSVVLRVDYGEVRILLTGDAEEETEERLLAGGADSLAATVLKVAHHGSKYATHKPFLDAVRPKLAVISCSADNTYGHPAPETLDRLRAKGVPALITSKLGHIVVSTDGRKIAVSHDRALPARMGDPRLDLNTARQADLEALPGIGPTLAARIVADRTANGPYPNVDALTRVSGIGEATVEKLRPMVTAR